MHHMPLKYALTEYQDDRDKLLALLSCLNRAAEVSDLIAELVESGEMFHVLRFTGKEAYQFLRDVEKIEQTGILCRIPNWWRKKAMECSVEIRLGEKKPAMVGFDAAAIVCGRRGTYKKRCGASAGADGGAGISQRQVGRGKS